jgi:uncharacterized protein YjiS (DUF1127 family)
MTVIVTKPADIATDRSIPIRMVTAVATERARGDYRRMLKRENHILADMGVSRRDISRAFIGCGGRP